MWTRAWASMNLLHNALKFTHPHAQVTQDANCVGERILIDVNVHWLKTLLGHGAQAVDFIDLRKKQGLNQAKWLGVKS